MNLAEGWGRETNKDRMRFFRMAFGSLRECQAILELSEGGDKQAVKDADVLAAHLYRLVRKPG